jgi:hypothetical protein
VLVEFFAGEAALERGQLRGELVVERRRAFMS